MDVIWLRQEGVRLNLNLTEEYKKIPYKDLEKICNGVGPAWFPKIIREKVTDYFEYFLISTNPHDFDYDKLEKTKANFKIANERLYENMKIQIRKDKSLSWWSFRKEKSRWRKRIQARFLYKACDKYGGKAFFK